jgi:predicted AlkP superfamily pyrophosphatase or phosphodiesterase
MPLVEYLNRFEGKHARRINPDQAIRPQVVALDESLRKEWGIKESLIEPGRFLNYKAAAQAKVSRFAFERRVREGLLRIEGIEDVYFRRELEAAGATRRPYLARYRRSYYARRASDFYIRFCQRCFIDSQEGGADHGSPYSYDTRVPILFWGMKVKAGRLLRPVYTVDLAPTLARALGLRPRGLDGRPVGELIR